MTNKRHLGIRAKLMLPGVMVVAVLWVLITWWWAPQHLADTLKDIQHSQQTRLKTLESALVDSLLSGNLGQLHSTLDAAVAHNPNWRALLLTDPAGQRLYPLTVPATGATETNLIAESIEFGGQPLGQITLTFDPSHELAQQARQIDLASLAILGFMVVGMVLNFVLQDWLIRKPVRTLLGIARRLEQGDFNTPIQIHSRDEIGALADGMEHMRVKLFEVTHSLSEQVQHTQTILENVVEGIITIDEHGVITTFNHAAESIFGYKSNEAIGRNVSMLMPEPYRGDHDGYLRRYLNTKQPHVIGQGREVLGRRKDGSTLQTLLQVSQIERDGRPTFIGLVRDITAQKDAENALLAAHAQAQQYLDTASVMLFSLDRQGCVRMINKKGCAVTGYTMPDLLGRDWFATCLPASDRDEISAFYQEVMAGHEPLFEYCQMKLVTRDQALRTLYLYGSVQHAIDGSIAGVLFSGEDITDSQRYVQERQQLQQQLHQSQKMEAIGQLTGGIAHDFNNMLAGILGFTELAHEHAQALGDRTLVSYLDQVNLTGARARDLVAKMLAFSRHRNVSAPTPIMLSTAIPDMMKLLRPVLPASVILRTELDTTAPPVLLDTVELQQLLLNLCINARDAMNAVGTLNIVVRKASLPDTNRNVHDTVCNSCAASFSGAYVELCVSDTGSGMDAATLKKAFEPFFTTKEVGKGTGMGLAMLHGIMHDRAGHIVVETEPGTGSRFRLMFPVPATG